MDNIRKDKIDMERAKNAVIVGLAVILVIMLVMFGIMYFEKDNNSVINNEEENNNVENEYTQLNNNSKNPKVIDYLLSDYIDILNSDEYFALYWVGEDAQHMSELIGKNVTQEQINKMKNIPTEIANIYREFALKYADISTEIYFNYDATSSLSEGSIKHIANNLRLYYHDKVWTEGVDGYGIGEKVVVKMYSEYPEHTTFDNPHYILNQILIENGYCKSKELWEKNARVKTLKLTLNDGTQYILNLEDTMKPQLFDVGFKTNGIQEPLTATFEILDIYEGTIYEDTVLTTIQLSCEDRGFGRGI